MHNIVWLIIACVLTLHTTTARADLRGLPSLSVLAPTSLTNAMTDIIRRYSRESGITVTATYANATELMEDVAIGKEADVYISESEENIKHLKQSGMIDVYSLKSIAQNQLVIASSKKHPIARYQFKNTQQLVKALTNREVPAALFVIGDPATVPLGQSTKTLLETLDAWKQIRAIALPTNSAKQAQYMVAKGQNVGMLYRSDALSHEDIVVLSTVENQLIQPITYQGAVVAGENMESARNFLKYLKTTDIQKIFKKHQFIIK